MKKVLGIFISTILLLTGCSSNTKEKVNIISQETETQISKENTIDYQEMPTYLTKNGEKLVQCLQNLNIDCKFSSKKTKVYSKEYSYKKYDTDYDSYLTYETFVDYHEEKKVKTNMDIKYSYHCEDAFDFDTPYAKLIYKVIQSQDRSLSENKVKKLIEDILSGNGDSIIFDNEVLNVQLYYEGATTCIKAQYYEELDIENEEIELVNEYETVKEFKDKFINLNSGEGYPKKYLNKVGNDGDPYVDPNISISYDQSNYGNLRESYKFDLSMKKDTQNYYNQSEYADIQMQPKDREYIEELINYMTEIIGTDISQYMTADELYEIVEEVATRRDVSQNGVKSTTEYAQILIGNLTVTMSHGQLHGVKIEIELPVIAEGKSIL